MVLWTRWWGSVLDCNVLSYIGQWKVFWVDLGGVVMFLKGVEVTDGHRRHLRLSFEIPGLSDV